MAIDAALGKVEAMAHRGAPLDEIETFIDSIPRLTADERAALWLLAWSEHDHHGQRRSADEALALLGG